jgi:two-component system sensor histidine kinase/response regulator
MTDSGRTHILYMEDDAGLARLLQKSLGRVGYSVDIARNGEEGLTMYRADQYDVVVLDQNMPIYNGLDVIHCLAAQGPLPPIIMVTGAGNEKIAVQALKAGAGDYIVKDVEGGFLELLPAVIEQVLYQHRLVKEKQQAERALRQYTVELEARNEELDAFAHTVAHDLKNPLSNVITYSEALLEYYDTMLDEERSVCLRTIAQSGRTIDNIIDELLLLAQVRKMEAVRTRLNMANIVTEARQRLIVLIERAQAEMTVPDMSAWPAAIGHEGWVKEVWVNYLSNAIKYGGQPPCIELGATLQPDGMARFWVRDNGNGLSPEALARLFIPFTRLDQVRAKGHGLGLSIVRRIVEKLGGQVGVESEGIPGRGSVFYFTLPAAPD